MLLLPKNAKIIAQGLTGSEGSRSLPWVLKYGTNIIAGVTPGKGGQKIQDIPIFNSVKEAIKEFGEIDGSVQFVPPNFVKKATIEAIEAGIKFVLIGAEKVPTKDASYIYEFAKNNGANVVGPNSIGIINPTKKLKLGLIGGGNPSRMFVPGEIAVISKSGSATAEISLSLKNSGMGISWAIGIGGDRIIGSDFVDFLLELEKDKQTKASVIFGELGGTYEERVAKFVKEGKIQKPVIALIAGDFTTCLPNEVQFGHAGAMIEGNRGCPKTKRIILKESGVIVANDMDDIPNLLLQALKSS
ncbi:MAG: succinate--CoA ligase subunit alpha [Candidatus Magasanikbacteria bacterium CG_4_9_14_3_um_filter_32_9]|uniref:Succinate--CoA ligase subunit alpha n=1 Tax=Candidatus Magasanikbacteria bacterium CG_4_9_14_3_um_filter_32_9 TaxID=1974644 RepID=A0A2M7Z6M1_9BACT|nr:MAG: succinate--CoA ligase subunit alpha [Candidatus Magasanikbacteria bacterium CG_4_9_14_3_um_filter_32_9]